MGRNRGSQNPIDAVGGQDFPFALALTFASKTQIEKTGFFFFSLIETPTQIPLAL